jgi:hypothetical protein
MVPVKNDAQFEITVLPSEVKIFSQVRGVFQKTSLNAVSPMTTRKIAPPLPPKVPVTSTAS